MCVNTIGNEGIGRSVIDGWWKLDGDECGLRCNICKELGLPAVLSKAETGTLVQRKRDAAGIVLGSKTLKMKACNDTKEQAWKDPTSGQPARHTDCLALHRENVQEVSNGSIRCSTNEPAKR